MATRVVTSSAPENPDGSRRHGAAAGGRRPSRPERRTFVPAALTAMLLGALTPGATAQGAKGNDAPTRLTTPDGSTFLLVPDATMPIVHWAIATPVDDPAAHPGLSAATMQSALLGTWRTGSNDGEAERRALDAHDDAFAAWLAAPTEPARAEAVARCTAAAERLTDRGAFARVLAALPVHRPEVVERHPVNLFLLTTSPEALPELARILVERREQQALRELQPSWAATSIRLAAMQVGDPLLALRREVLTLAIPDHPYGRLLETPTTGVPRRTEAFAVWNATQRPERTVHVVLGGFDADALAATLRQTFATTGLPPAPPPATATIRPIRSQRRSLVQGVPPTVVIAFLLPPDVPRDLLTIAARWLGDGADSRVGQELQRLGRKRATVRTTAPWPPTIGGQSLFTIEVGDPDGIDQLAEQTLKACRQATQVAPTASALQAVIGTLQRERTELANDPRALAAAIAETAVAWPRQPLDLDTPLRAEPKAVLELLGRIVSTPPIVVEGRP